VKPGTCNVSVQVSDMQSAKRRAVS